MDTTNLTLYPSLNDAESITSLWQSTIASYQNVLFPSDDTPSDGTEEQTEEEETGPPLTLNFSPRIFQCCRIAQ